MAEEADSDVAMLNKIAQRPTPSKRKLDSSPNEVPVSKRMQIPESARKASVDTDLNFRLPHLGNRKLGRPSQVEQTDTRKPRKKRKSDLYDEIAGSGSEKSEPKVTRAPKLAGPRKQRKLGPRRPQDPIQDTYANDITGKPPVDTQRSRSNVMPNTSATRSTKSPRRGRPKGSKSKSLSTVETLEAKKQVDDSEPEAVEVGPDAPSSDLYQSAPEAVVEEVAQTASTRGGEKVNSFEKPQRLEGSQTVQEDEEPGEAQEHDVYADSMMNAVVTPGEEADAEKETHDHKMYLGKGRLWMDIKGSVADVWKSSVDVTTRTNFMKELREDIKRVRRLYKNGCQRKVSVKDVERQLPDELDYLEQTFNSVHRDIVGKRRGELVQDIYVTVVPHSIMLLKWAMKFRVLHPSTKKAYDLHGLEEIILIQDCIVNLCRKVSHWGIKPSTEVPITRSIKQRAFPYLKQFNGVFRRALKDEQIVERKRRNTEMFATREPDEETDWEAQESATQRRVNAELDYLEMIRQGVRDEQRRIRRQAGSRHVLRPISQQRADTPEPIVVERRHVEWTQEEEEELIDKLLNDVESRNLPQAKQRYDKILHTPALQNKLVEHIREKALQFKTAIIEALEEDARAVPNFVHSIA